MPTDENSGGNGQTVLFSIILPVYNRRAYLATAIYSISQQTCAAYEVIVIDDGSTDETAEYVETLRDVASILHQNNSGVSMARNRGARIAKGKYLVFLDSDDVLLPWSLQSYSEVIDRFQPAIISARTIEFEEELPTIEGGDSQEVRVTLYNDYLSNAENYCFVGASCLVIKADVFARSNGFSNEMRAGEDYDLLLRAGVERPYARIEAPVTVGYRVHPGNDSKKVDWLVEGSSRLLAREAAGIYPGGPARASDRITIIGRVVRPVILASLQRGRRQDAWYLYRKSFRMHIRAMRVRFLVAAAFLMVFAFSQEATRRFSRIRVVR